jgi:hypothetical protein
MKPSLRPFVLPFVADGAAVGVAALPALAEDIVITYEDLDEGFKGETFTHMGVTYRDVNQVSGVFPSGETFGPQELEQVIVENATVVFWDFPDFGSPVNTLTFANAYIPGENCSIGRIASVTMDLPGQMSAASVQMVYYENGPWGGIVYHLDAKLNGVVVASDSFTIADGGGRDNPAMASLSVSAPAFDELHLYATFGDDYSMPRALLDNLTLTPVAGSACVTDFDGSGSVNSTDISAFLTAWLNDLNNGTLVTDFNNSGDVNSSDISAFLTAWLADLSNGC